MTGSMLNYTCVTWAQHSNFAAVKFKNHQPNPVIWNLLHTLSHFFFCLGMLQACDAKTKLTIYPNRSKQTVLWFWLFFFGFLVFCFFFFTSENATIRAISCWQFGSWSASIPSCILVSWHVCRRWHVFWQCLDSDCSWVKSPAMVAGCQHHVHHPIFDKFVTPIPQSNCSLKPL